MYVDVACSRFWAADKEVIDLTLELFVELTSFGNGKLLLSLEAVTYILTHHTVSRPCSFVVVSACFVCMKPGSCL